MLYFTLLYDFSSLSFIFLEPLVEKYGMEYGGKWKGGDNDPLHFELNGGIGETILLMRDFTNGKLLLSRKLSRNPLTS